MPAAPWKKLVRFIAAEDGLVYTGEPLETADADLGLALKEGKPIRVRCLQGSVLSPRSALGSRLMTVKQLLSPLDPAVIKTVRALGINFKPTPEFKRTPIPVLFYKPTSTISHTGAVLPLPKFARDEQADYEVELCVVIGKRCKDVTEEEALDYVLGYTVAQDVSARSLCAKGIQFGLGKSFDGWLPLGPCLVSPQALGGLDKLELKTFVNDELKQYGQMSEILYGVKETISILSQGTTLEAGSIILMGTPPPLEAVEGKPRQWLKHGDVVQVTIPGIGSIINKVEDVESQRSTSAPVKAKL